MVKKLIHKHQLEGSNKLTTMEPLWTLNETFTLYNQLLRFAEPLMFKQRD